MAFVAIHVLTAVLDPYVTIRIAAIVIPFISSYKPLWLGLGAVSLDLMPALIVTSLPAPQSAAASGAPCTGWPTRPGRSRWCTASTSSNDLHSGPLLYLALGCIAAVIGALGWRLTPGPAPVPRGRAAVPWP